MYNDSIIFKTLIAIWLIVLIAWIGNIVKFTSCDFESDFKCEVIHGIGVFVVPASIITVWFDTDE